jgi:tungstate transport system substrate-binding protein
MCKILLFCCFFSQASLASDFITLASTTSTEQSGLFAHLLPIFEKQHAIKVRVLALGTGQALDTARRGDADVLLVHDEAAETRFVAEGYGLKRLPVMFNDFVLVGPVTDPAKARGQDILTALKTIQTTQATFVSRGDKSGTHAAELRYWGLAGIEPSKSSGYKSVGQSMGAVLNTAQAMQAYTLSDRGTWLAFKNKSSLTIVVEGDKRLANQYGVIAVNPAKWPHVKATAAQVFVNWLVSPAGQGAIGAYKINGEALFFANANANPW